MIKSVFQNSAGRLALGLSLLWTSSAIVSAQDPQTSPTPVDEKARARAEKEAKKAAAQEEKMLKAAAEKERKEAEASAKRRLHVAPETDESRAKKDVAIETPPAPSQANDPEQNRNRKAEERARSEAEKARKKEENRLSAEEAKDIERRRKDEERVIRESAKAREIEDQARASELRKQQEEAAKEARRNRASGDAVSAETPPAAVNVTGGKEEEKRRKELVKQIEKARAERDRLNRDADGAETLARAARNAANDGQRNYEALTTGLEVADITLPAPAADAQPKKSRFVTKADEKAAVAQNAPFSAPDPLRIALDLKKTNPEDREKAAFALAALGPDAQPATRALMAALADANASVRIAAAQALGRIGPGASAAVAPLSAALSDPDPAVKNAAQAALVAIQGRY